MIRNIDMDVLIFKFLIINQEDQFIIKKKAIKYNCAGIGCGSNGSYQQISEPKSIKHNDVNLCTIFFYRKFYINFYII